jgi:cell division protein FtsI/penicillin-binding protein 2
VVRLDRSELVPLWRHRYEPRHKSVRALLAKKRDLTLTVDMQLETRAARLLREQVNAGGIEHGAVVAVDPATGDLLASVSYPWPQGPIKGDGTRVDLGGDDADAAGEDMLLDRARYGVYPPGSTFKIVTAAAALTEDPALANARFTCRGMSDGVGTVIHGRLVHDDTADRPHGTLAMEDATAVSCNAYYAQLGSCIGWPVLSAMAERFGIATGHPASGAEDAFAIESAYGQAQVTATPLEMARVAAVVAAQGRMPEIHWATEPGARDSIREILNPSVAATLGRYMRGVVTRGTGRRLAGRTPAVAGKTGTAQVADGRAHAWFIGFAPYGPARRRVAFAVLLEHGGSGGGRAAELGGQLAAEAQRLGYAQ